MSKLRTAKDCATEMWSGDAASKALGMKVEIRSAGGATARMTVREDMINGFGVCHGGLVFALADTAFAFACNAYNRQTVAASGSIEFMRPVRLGDELRATATEEYRGRKTGFYSVRVENQDGKTVALFNGRSVSRPDAILKTDTPSVEK